MMASLDRNLRKGLETAVKKARFAAEKGARQAIEQLAVHDHEPRAAQAPEQRKLRNRLRAHGRQLGDRLDERKGTQEVERLVGECAYEHWHRLLFARFLAENELLVEPDSGMPIPLTDCQELARERRMDWLVLASDFAQRMLPQIFRAGDPVLDVALPPETRQELERLLELLPRETFVADDSLGWVYQFWQAEQKEKVNESGKKIGAEELPAVTQLFTEDYMVLFLLHNTLGAWWAGKVLVARPEIALAATTEDELRAACALPGIGWEYLRFVKGEEDGWRPAGGTFDGWPRAAKDITVLDPCMGSGHFLVFALPILAAFRQAEEAMSREAAVDAALRDNLFGLEIDPRCTQIAAFNLALAAWRQVGFHPLPALNLACSGLAPSAQKEDWVALAGDSQRHRNGMERLYELFEQAPTLGSLIDPGAAKATLFEADFDALWPLFERAMARETADDAVRELAVTAAGVARAAQILAGQFTLVSTNVPYLGRGKQDDVLKNYCERVHPEGKADLATCFVKRCLDFCLSEGATALVTPQNWWFLGSYKALRHGLLTKKAVKSIVALGEEAWQAFGDRGPVAALMVVENQLPINTHAMIGIDALRQRTIEAKLSELLAGEVEIIEQSGQYRNPDHRITIGPPINGPLLKNHASCLAGILNGDSMKFQRFFWDFPARRSEWVFQQTTVDKTVPFGGRKLVIFFDEENGHLREDSMFRRDRLHDSDQRGNAVWRLWGVAVSQMRTLPVTLYSGEKFDSNVAVICPRDQTLIPAIWAFCSSDEFVKEVRRVDKKVNVTNASMVKVSFDLAHWQQVAAKKYADGLPKPYSDNPTQWLFNGHPMGSVHPLQVAVARLLTYRWPRQTGSSFPDCPALGPDGLEAYADDDGIVCLMPLKGEQAAADRLRALLAAAFGSEWSPTKLNQLLTEVDYSGKSLEDWLRDGFFGQHCNLFDQRPFVWQIWDGLKNGFSVLVNYHKLAAPDGEGRRTLEKLIYTYLGDWIDRQRADQTAGVEGADGRVAAAVHLKRELEKILEGEPPFDIFVRWKPLHEQPIGWDPDLNDGVRLNIRPFMTARPLNARGKNDCVLRTAPRIKWDKDRGSEPNRPRDQYPWFWAWDGKTESFSGGAEFDGNRWNDLHYSHEVKGAARRRAGTGEKA